MDFAGIDTALSTLSGYSATSSASTGSLAYAVGLSVLNMNMEATESLGQGMAQMLEASVTPHLGGTIDMYV